MHTHYADIHHTDLQTLLETVQPASVLLIDPHPQGLPQTYLDAHPNCRVTRLQDEVWAQMQALGRFDLGVVANTLEYLDRKTAGMVLARLRDVNTARFVALLPLGRAWPGLSAYWEEGDLLAYGMSVMARYRVDDKPSRLYHYAIQSYKTTPDWFNSRNWAHPERWKP